MSPIAIELNSIINVKVESKKLRLSHDKCYKIHIGRKNPAKRSGCNIDLKVHDKEMKPATEAKYLGDILNEDGTINETVEDRRQKLIGIVSQISSILSSISLGFSYIEIALILRESLLINGTLTNSEVWPKLTKSNLESLETSDLSLLIEIFKAHSKTASELFIWKLGKYH